MEWPAANAFHRFPPFHLANHAAAGFDGFEPPCFTPILHEGERKGVDAEGTRHLDRVAVGERQGLQRDRVLDEVDALARPQPAGVEGDRFQAIWAAVGYREAKAPVVHAQRLAGPRLRKELRMGEWHAGVARQGERKAFAGQQIALHQRAQPHLGPLQVDDHGGARRIAMDGGQHHAQGAGIEVRGIEPESGGTGVAERAQAG